MQRTRWTVPAVAGAYVALHGALFSFHWARPIDALASALPNSASLGLANPLLILAIAVCFWASIRPPAEALRTTAFICALLLVAVPAAYIAFEFVRAGATGPTRDHSWVRLSPNASLCFLTTGLAFLSQRWPQALSRRVLLFSAILIGFIGLMGLLGQMLALPALYRIANFNRLLPSTALAFAVVGAGLWALHERAQLIPAQAIEGRITRRTLAVISLAALCCGATGFAVMRESFEKSASQNLSMAAKTAVTSLSYTLRSSLVLPRTIVQRPAVVRALQRLSEDPSDAVARERLQLIASNLLASELERTEFYNADGALVTEAGTRTDKLLRPHKLTGMGQGATLGFNAGYVLVVRSDVTLEGRYVGRLVTEQHLPLFESLLAGVRTANASSDAAICSRDSENTLTCGPTRFRSEGFALPIRASDGSIAYPVARAVLGQTGVELARDLRGVEVVSAFAPIDEFGLGIAVKSDVAELMEPLRERVWVLALAVTLIIGLSVYALRSLVRPVVKRLAESERSMKAILEDQSELVSVAKPSGELTYVNPAYARHWGLRPEEMLGKNLFDHVAPADLEKVRGIVAKVLETGQPLVGENRILQRSGEPRWVAWTNNCQRDESGEAMLHSVGRDITERRKAELALQETLAALARTGKVAGVGGWELNIATEEVSWTDETRRIHEVPPEYTPTLKSALDFYYEDARAVMDDAVQSAIATRQPFEVITRLKTAKGRLIFVRAQGQVEFEDGKPARLVGAIQDITARRELEQKLAASERFVRKVTDSLPVRIAYVDRDLRIQFVNEAHAKRFGLPVEEMLGKTRQELTHVPFSPETSAAISEVLAGKEQVFEFDEEQHGGTVRIEGHLIPDVADDGSVLGFYATGVDITERSTAERALRDLATIFDNTSDYVVQTDFEGRIVYANPAAERAFASPGGPVVGRIFSEFLSLPTIDYLRETILPAARMTGLWVGETAVNLPSGRSVPINHMLIAHRLPDGKVGRYSAIMRDISVEAAAKAAQQRDAATLRSVTETIPVIVGVVGADMRYRFVNSAFERWLGKPRDQVVGKRVEDVISAAEFKRNQPFIARTLNGETVQFVRDYTDRPNVQQLGVTYIPLRLDDGTVDGFVGLVQDITAQKAEEKRLLQLSQRDSLTGLLNRAGFDEYFAHALEQADPAGLALLYIDLDRFKGVNDTHGHLVGDELLRHFADRLRGTVRPTDGVARLGGDEFAVVIPGLKDTARAKVVADAILAASHAPFQLGAVTAEIGASVGVAFAVSANLRPEDVLGEADRQLYKAKSEGRGRASFSS